MKRKWGILAGVILLSVLAAGLWLCFRPQKAITASGNLTIRDVAEIKRVVEKDVRGRVLPKFSWANFRGLGANLRAYFKYKILEIDSMDSSHAQVKLGDGATVATSGRTCEYGMFKGPKGWQIMMIYVSSPGWVIAPGAPRVWTPAMMTNFLRPPPMRGSIPPRPLRTDAPLSPMAVDALRPFRTNIAVPQMTLQNDRPPASANFAPPPPPTNSRTTSSSNDARLRLPSPSGMAVFQNTVISLGVGSNGAPPTLITYGMPVGPMPRLILPSSGASLTNLMPVGP